jgi:biotin carboxyl carrier protein
MRYIAKINDHTFKVELTNRPERLDVTIDGKPIDADWEWLGRDRDMSLVMDGRSYNITIEPENDRLLIYYAGERFECDVQDERLAELRHLAGDTEVSTAGAQIKAPMPGLILRILIEPGQQVKKNERLIIIEAMKMENEIKAPRSGVIKTIDCSEQKAVEQGKILIVLE